MKNLKITLFAGAMLLLFNANLSAEVAKITKLSGYVEYMPLETGEWVKAELNLRLKEGDKLMTAADGFAAIMFYAGHNIELAGNSSIVIKEANNNRTNLELFKGKLRSKVRELSKEQVYIIQTPQAVAAVRGTDFLVSIENEVTRVEVFDGVVEARELITGEMVEIMAGQFSEIVPNQRPSQPIELPAVEEKIEKVTRKEEKAVDRDKESARESARREMFEEISYDAVISRAAEEVKLAEYENGKALIDAHGNRVRLEEYIVRPSDNEFKYVVLNHRENRFDFGKIHFTFNNKLPEDLTLATENMFYSEEKPQWILTDLTSVMSNTLDQVNEVASGGNMLQDVNYNWRHYFRDYEFSIKGDGRAQKTLWTQTVYSTEGLYENIKVDTYLNDPDVTMKSEYQRPVGDDVFHLYIKDTYSDGTWIAVDDYLIDDDGNIIKSADLKDNFAFGSSLNDYLSKLNFERKYTSSEFGDRDIDLVFSTKLLLDSGMLNVAIEPATN